MIRKNHAGVRDERQLVSREELCTVQFLFAKISKIIFGYSAVEGSATWRILHKEKFILPALLGHVK
jgi:hypothetical protein